MKITGLELYKAKQLSVRGITQFKATFTSIYQMIIGTNGSGKSFILSQLSPLPPAPKLFESGGYKKFYCTHRGKSFECENYFDGNSSIHSFKVDGVELNQNGTAAIQKELVESYFSGLTQEKFNILTSRKFFKFTDMDTNKRRKVLMEMSGIDLDLALNVFQAMKTKTRDFTGHVKRLNQKLGSESQVLLEDDEVKELEEKLIKLKQDFDTILRLYNSQVKTHDEMDEIIRRHIESIESLNTKLDTYLKSLSNQFIHENVKDVDSLGRYLSHLETIITTTNDELSNLYTEFEKVNGELIKLKEAGLEGINEYASIIDNFKTELELIDQELEKYDFKLECNQNSSYNYDVVSKNLEPILTECLTSMFDNSNQLITLEQVEFHKQQEFIERRNIAKFNDTKERIKHSIEHSKTVQSVNCPKCDYNFRPGIGENFDEYIEKISNELEKLLETSEKNLSESIEFLQKLHHYSAGFGKLEDIKRMYSNHDQLWDRIGDYGLETNTPRGAINILTNYVKVCEINSIKFNVLSSMEQKQIIFEQASKFDTKDLENTELQCKKINEKIEECLTRLSSTKKYHRELSILEKNIVEVHTTLATSEYLIDEMEKALVEDDKAQTNVLLDDILKEMKRDINIIENQVSTVRVQRAIVEEIKSSIEQAKFEQELHKTITDELSPTDGLIADVMRDFINEFTQNLNSIIGNVWTYSMVVLPCISNKDGLDYKFPLRVYDSDLPIPDVAEGSDGQLEMIDFAFKVIYMITQDMVDFPLYLDEAIARMDEVHRPEMIRLIESMVENHQCTQMFFISHYAAQHESFSNAEIMMTDSSNIVLLPTTYNQHVVLK